ncbi:MAG: prolyl oligopeptidase family serine peptidase [Acetobacteraceae bacterium]|nr:prolyl oligopeptidase family serine peptidase [Acetobacteraceae bacterium]
MQRLDGPRIAPAGGGPARQLVVLLHGLGADGADLAGLAPAWAEHLPDAAFIAPDAPFPCDMAPYGRQWFSLQDRSPERMLAGMRVVAPLLEAFLQEELAALDLSPAALALMGFSQGAMTALHVGLRGAVPPAAILAYSGALLAPDTLAAELRSRPPVLIVHGEADEVVPVWASRFAESALHEAGVPNEAIFVPGLGHGIEETGLAAGARLLRRVFGAGPAT